MIFQHKFSEYNVLSNGVDGGHYYLSAEIEYKGIKRKIIVLFDNKSDEVQLLDKKEILVTGNLTDEGLDQTLIMTNSIIIK